MQHVDFHYEISDERLIAYSRMPLLDRLKWLDEVRRFTLAARSAPAIDKHKPTPKAATRQSGLTLIELVIFIIIVSVALAGVLTVLNVTTQSSADPMIRKQMLTIAEALLEEVELLPFTWCDPSDANAAAATSATVGAGACSSLAQSFGQRSGQTRPLAGAPNTYTFNNVANNCAIPTTGGASCPILSLASPIPDVSQVNTAPAGYSATIALTAEPLGPVATQIASGNPASANDASLMNVLRITVTVTHGSDSIVLEGYRTRHSPNFF